MVKYLVPFETLSKSADQQKPPEKSPMTERLPMPFLTPATHATLNEFKIGTQRAKEYIDREEKRMMTPRLVYQVI